MWAGAHVRPIPIPSPSSSSSSSSPSSHQLRREAAWLKLTVAELSRHLAADPHAGIARVPGIEYLGAPPPEYLAQDAESFAAETGLSGFRKYAAHELPEGAKLGFEYETYCINAPLYSGNLLRKFILQGGQTAQANLGSEWEPYSWGEHVKLVVNATGMGFKDAKCFPIRGSSTDDISTRLSS